MKCKRRLQKRKITGVYKIINLYKSRFPPVSLQTKHMKRFLVLFLVCFAFTRTPFITGCANIVPPTGGPRDSLPPALVNSTPVNHALHMSTNTIVLNFNEYLDLKELRNNLIVSPVPKQMPTVTSHLKTITITIKDTLQPNTTYALDFGNSIVDVNEGNILRNFNYVFSTGTYIDSLSYSGKVIMANTGKPDSTLIALLHIKLDDSAVANEKPRYITRLDSSGNFSFKHIRPATYALYAMKDEAGTHEYSSKFQVFAFADSPVNLTQNTAPLLLYAYSDTSDTKKPKKTPTVPVPKKQDKEKIKRLGISGNIAGGQLDLHNQLELSFVTPIRNFDSSKIRFTTDSFQNIKAYHMVLDSTKKKLTLFYAWKENTGYRVIIQKDFAEDTLGETLLKIDTIGFRTKKESEYGNLRLRFRNLDLSLHPVLLFIVSEKIILSYPVGKSLRYNNKLFNPGEYEIRILYDTNQNGVWDPGDFWKHRQPEIIVPMRKNITVRPDWDNEVDITL